MPVNDFTTFSGHLKTLQKLKKQLPPALPIAKPEGRISQVFTSLPVPENPIEQWEVFDRRLNALWSEDKRVDGRLPHIELGEYGIDMALAYFEDCVTAGNLQWGAAIPKVARLIDEFRVLITAGMSSTSSKGKANTTKASGKAAGKRKAPVDSEDDEDYAPPARGRRNEDGDVPEQVFNSEGEEVTQESDILKEIKEKRAKKRAKTSDLRTESSSTSQNKTSKGKGKRRVTVEDVPELDTDIESDGESAARCVESADAVPQKPRRGPANQNMVHFTEPIPTVVNDKKRWELHCRYCNCTRTFARTVCGDDPHFDDEPQLPPLNNLATHIKKCPKKAKHDANQASEPAEAEFNYRQSVQIMADFLKDGKLNPAIVPSQRGFNRIFSAWIFDKGLAWTAGQAPLLRDLFRYVKVKFGLPTDTTVHNQLARIFAELHGEVVREFSSVKSKIAYVTDTWTTKQMVYTFAATIASFINDEWELIERVVDFKPLEDKEHEGYHAARAFIKGAREIGGLNKITLTTDGASVNNVLFATASRYLLSLYDIPEHPDHHLHCLAHVINIVVQAILAELKEADFCENDGDENDYFFQHKDSPIHYDVADNEDLRELEENRDADLEQEDEEDPLAELLAGISLGDKLEPDMDGITDESPLKRLRFIVTKICSSPQRRKAFWQASKKRYGDQRVDPDDPKSTLLCALMVIKDVCTRWNSTHAMLGRALLLSDAIDDWVHSNKEYCSLGLRPKEWEGLQVMCRILEPFTEATRLLSSSSCPTLPFVLPIYLDLNTHLTEAIADFSLPSATHHALSIGKEKLDKYMTKAQANHTYIIGTVLHPSLRAEWFRKNVPKDSDARKLAIAQEAEVDHVKTIFKSAARGYRDDYVQADPPQPGGSTPAVTSLGRTGSASRLESICSVEFAVQALPSMSAAQQLDNELSRYYRFEGGRAALMNPLAWWKANEHTFPILSKMARDYLAIPATSVSVERLFSRSRHICTDLRSSLRAETIREALLTKVWIRSGHFLAIPRARKVEKHGSAALVDL